jgi:predicted Zn-dependent protease
MQTTPYMYNSMSFLCYLYESGICDQPIKNEVLETDGIEFYRNCVDLFLL